jgi:hypothetical protein
MFGGTFKAKNGVRNGALQINIFLALSQNTTRCNRTIFSNFSSAKVHLFDFKRT